MHDAAFNVNQAIGNCGVGGFLYTFQVEVFVNLQMGLWFTEMMQYCGCVVLCLQVWFQIVASGCTMAYLRSLTVASIVALVPSVCAAVIVPRVTSIVASTVMAS